MLRSGSSSDIGPKQNMEDEYICIDNFHKHFGAAPNIPSPGAFYGVPNLLFVYFTAISLAERVEFLHKIALW